MSLEELLQNLRELTYNTVVCGCNEKFPLIKEREFYQVENLIRQYALDNHDATVATLEAKIKVYEAVIYKSNFSPLFINEDGTRNI